MAPDNVVLTLIYVVLPQSVIYQIHIFAEEIRMTKLKTGRDY